MLDICIRISPAGKRQQRMEKILQPFPCVPKEAVQQRATQADDIWV